MCPTPPCFPTLLSPQLGDSKGAMAALRERLASGGLADSRGYSAFISAVSKVRMLLSLIGSFNVSWVALARRCAVASARVD